MGQPYFLLRCIGHCLWKETDVLPIQDGDPLFSCVFPRSSMNEVSAFLGQHQLWMTLDVFYELMENRGGNGWRLIQDAVVFILGLTNELFDGFPFGSFQRQLGEDETVEFAPRNGCVAMLGGLLGRTKEGLKGGDDSSDQVDTTDNHTRHTLCGWRDIRLDRQIG